MNKTQDDYKGKIRLWAGTAPRARVVPVPVGLPRFGSRKFSSYAEMNAWKRAYILETLRTGGVAWTRP